MKKHKFGYDLSNIEAVIKEELSKPQLPLSFVTEAAIERMKRTALYFGIKPRRKK